MNAPRLTRMVKYTPLPPPPVRSETCRRVAAKMPQCGTGHGGDNRIIPCPRARVRRPRGGATLKDKMYEHATKPDTSFPATLICMASGGAPLKLLETRVEKAAMHPFPAHMGRAPLTTPKGGVTVG